jgi:hypothetical protein
MTIRENIQKKVVASILAWAIGFLFAFISISATSTDIKTLFKIFAGICFIYAFIASNFLIKCPRCSGNLSRSSMKGQTKTNFCPSCGVSLDEKI